MPILPTDLRNKLERVVIEARDVAEAGARAALEALAVHHHEPYPHMKSSERRLRNRLRARARQLGDRQDASGRLTIDHLVVECAYEHWHRMLFSRFLAENNLLIEPDEKMAISLAEAEELAKDEGVDVWVFASRCAQDMLPQIFRPGDPLLHVSFATEHWVKLENLLASLPQAVFTASDALGWVYQFWQTKRKKQVNDSEVKIGADEISAVTQLFTEPYMVDFLLHNTLGAWWAGKRLSDADLASAESEEELRAKLALPGVAWDYLRFVRGEDGTSGPWRPAAGTFDGWPQTAAEIKVLDPCCGSGHFLVAALRHLAAIRMAEEGLSAIQAVDAVLRDNLHGLEIDERCCQIAAFALAFAAWTFPDADGYRELPELHIACTGIGPQCSAEQWIKLAAESGIPMPRGGRDAVVNGLFNLHRIFSQAPTLGSLIDPTELPNDMFAADFETIQPYLTAIMKAEKADSETRERAIAAAGMVKAAELLTGEYTFVTTNVPYLGLERQAQVLAQHLKDYYPKAKRELATCFLMRSLELTKEQGLCAIVLPSEWTYLRPHRHFRQNLLTTKNVRAVIRLGKDAFSAGIRANPALFIGSNGRPNTSAYLEVDTVAYIDKPAALANSRLLRIRQQDWLANPDCRILAEAFGDAATLSEFAEARTGLSAGDAPRFEVCYWEVCDFNYTWQFLQSSVAQTEQFAGRSEVVRWENEEGEMAKLAESVKHLNHAAQNWRRGKPSWGRRGVALSLMGDLAATLYSGDRYDINCCAVIPTKDEYLPALTAFAMTGQLSREIRKIDQSLKVGSPNTLLNVAFDFAHWKNVATEKYPEGLPEPESDDPTQWLFHGHPSEAQKDASLQVAVARLLGYRWPAELDPDMRLSQRARSLVKECEKLLRFADDDGIVCIPSVRGEEPAADRLIELLTACKIEPGVDLDDWLRNRFFQEHCELFHHRPFIWHIWDGRKRDGFHALVNYHKLCEEGGKGRRLLESLTYAYLGDWITRQKEGVKRGEEGAEDRLAAALELQKRLEAILAGEPPFDIFVRWKPLHEQAIGWEPDINDGVRMNIRPFLASDLPSGLKGAGILRSKPKSIKWTKDRGKEAQRPKAEYPWFWGWDEKTEDFLGGETFDGKRWNDCHYTNKVKQAAREAAGKRES